MIAGYGNYWHCFGKHNVIHFFVWWKSSNVFLQTLKEYVSFHQRSYLHFFWYMQTTNCANSWNTSWGSSWGRDEMITQAGVTLSLHFHAFQTLTFPRKAKLDWDGVQSWKSVETPKGDRFLWAKCSNNKQNIIWPWKYRSRLLFTKTAVPQLSYDRFLPNVYRSDGNVVGSKNSHNMTLKM